MTGGIGAGKSTVAQALADRGAVVIDADAVARDVVAPGTDAYRRVVDQFGRAVVAPDGALDRAAIADLVFRDDDARATLNAIVHPEVMREIADRVDAMKDTDVVVVLDVPLLVEIGGGEGLDLRVTVEADEETRIARVVRARGMSPEDVRARIAVQASPEQREALADVVIRNDGTEADLRAQADTLWTRIQAVSPPADN